MDREIQCWGYDANARTIPPLGQYYRLESSADTNCVLDENGEITCWGRDSYVTEASHPDGSFLEIGVGDIFACVLDKNGEIMLGL